MINKIQSFIESNDLQNSNIVVALSGGPDSVCLLTQLHRIKELYNLTLSAAYINHAIRTPEENKSDFNLIQKLCNEISVPLHVKEFKAGELELRARDKGVGVEAIAREVRYAFFDTLIMDKRTFIALGHNRDDQIETQIMRFFQGSSLEGLLGIKAINKPYIRPLYSIKKEQILDYLDKENISYNIDKTNLENNYLRNSIRNRLIPLIKDIFPGYNNSLQKIEDEFSLIHRILESEYNSDVWKKKGSFWVLDYSYFMQHNFYIRKKLIYDIFDKTYAGNIKDYRLPERFLKPLNKDSLRNGEKVLEGHGFLLHRNSDYLIWSKVDRCDERYYSEVFKPSELLTDKLKISILEKSDMGLTISGLSFPFVIRSYHMSDKKKLKRLKLAVDDSNTFIIEKSYNNIYAIISNSKLIYEKYNSIEGLTIKIENI